MPRVHRKRVKHYHEPGDCHELTFSCYDRLPLLDSEPRCALLSQFVQRALERWRFQLVAFVFMPEHVHLIVFPADPAIARVGDLLKAIKQPFSRHIKELNGSDDELSRLTVREAPANPFSDSGKRGPDSTAT